MQGMNTDFLKSTTWVIKFLQNLEYNNKQIESIIIQEKRQLFNRF